MSYVIRTTAGEINTDDFTLADLGWCEEQSGTPWSIQNPWKSIKVAKAMHRTALVRLGVAEADAEAATERLTLRQMKSMFQWREDEAADIAGDDAGPLGSPPPNIPPSSPGASDGSRGRAKKPGGSGTGT